MKQVFGWMFKYTVRVCALHHSMGLWSLELFGCQLQLVCCTYLLSVRATLQQCHYYNQRYSREGELTGSEHTGTLTQWLSPVYYQLIQDTDNGLYLTQQLSS